MTKAPPTAAPTPIPAFAPELRLEEEESLLLFELEELAGWLVNVDVDTDVDIDVADDVGEGVADVLVEEMVPPRETGIAISSVGSSEEQQSVLLVPQHHFVALSVSPQGVRGAVPSAECCY